MNQCTINKNTIKTTIYPYEKYRNSRLEIPNLMHHQSIIYTLFKSNGAGMIYIVMFIFPCRRKTSQFARKRRGRGQCAGLFLATWGRRPCTVRRPPPW